MSWFRKYMSRVVLAASLSTSFSAASAADDLTFTPQEDLTIRHMAAQGVQQFLMMNEKRGRLIAVDQGRAVLDVPAISGKNRGDNLIQTPASTPAGIYPLTISRNQTASDAVMVFDDKGPYAYVIHRAGGFRLDRLNGKKPFTNPEKDLRVSTGCISTRSEDYNMMSQFATYAAQQAGMNPGAGQKALLVILPETDRPEETARFLKMPPKRTPHSKRTPY